MDRKQEQIPIIDFLTEETCNRYLSCREAYSERQLLPVTTIRRALLKLIHNSRCIRIVSQMKSNRFNL